MSYCTIANIIEVIPNSDLVQLTNDDGGSTVDNDKITNAIEFSTSMIDGYLRGRYTLPLLSTPDIIKYSAIDIVVYRLYCRRLLDEMPIQIQQKYDDTVKLLGEIQKNKFHLNTNNASELESTVMETDKSAVTKSTNKYYNAKKWDTYDSWLV